MVICARLGNEEMGRAEGMRMKLTEIGSNVKRIPGSERCGVGQDCNLPIRVCDPALCTYHGRPSRRHACRRSMSGLQTRIGADHPYRPSMYSAVFGFFGFRNNCSVLECSMNSPMSMKMH